MEYTGYVSAGGYDEVIFRRHTDPGAVIVFWLRDRRVLAGMNVNVWDVAEDIGRLVRSSEQVDLGLLANPAVPLNQVTQAVAIG
jgi:3-phenylpropionate/trans-cinnamate dioxygenase ferredoxin reductase component